MTTWPDSSRARRWTLSACREIPRCSRSALPVASGERDRNLKISARLSMVARATVVNRQLIVNSCKLALSRGPASRWQAVVKAQGLGLSMADRFFLRPFSTFPGSRRRCPRRERTVAPRQALPDGRGIRELGGVSKRTPPDEPDLAAARLHPASRASPPCPRWGRRGCTTTQRSWTRA